MKSRVVRTRPSVGAASDRDIEGRSNEDRDDVIANEGRAAAASPRNGFRLSVGRDDGADDYDGVRSVVGYRRSSILTICIISVVLASATLLLLLNLSVSKGPSGVSLEPARRIPVEYSCPRVERADNHLDPSFEADYAVASRAISENMTEFLAVFRESHFDGWGKTYEEVKHGMYHFKETNYAPHLSDGDAIYESACGIGLNLYMTLEILLESRGIKNLIVYGNEYVKISAVKANAVVDNISPANARKGVICPGDSTDLPFVPSNSFDLVYTGYITPMQDPLNFKAANPKDDHFDPNEFYTVIGDSDEKDWKGQTLKAIQQQRQDDWYGTWVAEMTRIAKPGAPVGVEQVSQRLYDYFLDWGGVNKDFWYESAKSNVYKWDVDPESIVIEDDIIFPKRYHVVMLKNVERETR